MQLKTHQKKVIEYMKHSSQKGIILYHTMGSGKTITAINIAILYNKKIICIVPASMKEQWKNEIIKTNNNINMFIIKSYETINKKPLNMKNHVVIIDEAHRLRNNGKITKRLFKNIKDACKIILLTGTPIVNDVIDLSVLINCVYGKYVMPLKEKSFNKKFFNDDKFNIELFNKIVKNTISFYEPENLDDYPQFDKYLVKMKMSKEQYEIYEKALTKISNTELHDLQNNKEIKKSINFNSFLNATRQISNTYQGNTDTPKLKKILKYIKQYEKPVIVYSNFLENGLEPIGKLLENENITYMKFTGENTIEEKTKIVNMYNNKLIDVLLLSSSGGEGLDLKNTRQIHIMEPHWNHAKIDQVIARGIRYKSHNDLPLNERHVRIYYWISLPYYNTKTDKIGADEYLFNMSDKKTIEINRYLEYLKKCSI